MVLGTQGCPWNEDTCRAAAEGGHLHILQWAKKEGCSWDEWTCTGAAARGNLEMLQWVVENGCPWDEATCEAAAAAGHLHILKWAHSQVLTHKLMPREKQLLPRPCPLPQECGIDIRRAAHGTRTLAVKLQRLDILSVCSGLARKVGFRSFLFCISFVLTSFIWSS